MWDPKSVSQAHTELGFENGLPVPLWPALGAQESLLVVLFKSPQLRASGYLSLAWPQ